MIRFGLFLLASIFCFACGDNDAKTTTPPAMKPNPTPVYYFFPKANVYFDSANKDYLFLGNDGTTWITQKQIPAAMQPVMDKSVLVEAPSQPVWKDNANHKLIYSAVLYASPADTVEEKAPPVIKPDTVVKKEKKRSGIRRFFDKLFGKKKKN